MPLLFNLLIPPFIFPKIINRMELISNSMKVSMKAVGLAFCRYFRENLQIEDTA